MFLKPFRVKSNAAIRGTDIKKWKSRIEEGFPALSSSDIAGLIPSKDGVTLSKLHTHGGESVNVLISSRQPIFFETDGVIYPTVYVTWKHPEILPAFTTWLQVFPKLLNGADLMLPGVVLRDGPNFDNRSFGRHAKGAPCLVNTTDNLAPRAVGKTGMSSEDMYLSAKRGKGVVILHTYSDNLWCLGDKSVIPELGPPFGVQPYLSDDDDNDDKENGSEPTNTTGSDAISEGVGALIVDVSQAPIADDPDRVPDHVARGQALAELTDEEDEAANESEPSGPRFETMDDLVLYCFLKAWKTTAKKVEPPLLTSAFYATHMVPATPRGHTLDIKKSTYKKLSKFLQTMQERDVVQVRELTKGVESIVEVKFQNELLRQFAVHPADVEVSGTDAAPSGGGARNAYRPPTFEEVYLVTVEVLPLFKLYRHGKGAAFSGPEVKQILTAYVKDNNLQSATQKGLVTLDPILTDVLLRKDEFNAITQLKWDEILTRCISKMRLAHRITFEGRPPEIRKGKIESIEITVASRAANKKVTLVNNVEAFGINPRELSHTVQLGVAASTSVNPIAGKVDRSQILIQGNQVLFLTKLFLDDYKIPKKYIKGLELAPKRGKK